MNEKIYLMEMQHNTDEHETDRLIAYLKKTAETTIKKPSIEHTMDYLVEYLADEYAADIAQEKYSSENSPLSELGEEKYKMDEYRRNVRFFSGTALTG